MNWKTFENKRNGSNAKYDFEVCKIREKDGKFMFIGNPKFCNYAKKFKFSEILFDVSNKKIAFNFLNNKTKKSFSVSTTYNESNFMIGATSFFKTLKLEKFSKKHYKFELKDGLWIADLNKPLEEKDNG